MAKSKAFQEVVAGVLANKTYTSKNGDVSKLRQAIIKTYISGVKPSNFMGHISDVVTLCLGEHGNNFYATVSQMPSAVEIKEPHVQGRFSPALGMGVDKISLRSSFFPPNSFSPKIYDVLAHETMHKNDQDLTKSVKYFGSKITPDNEASLFAFNSKIGTLIGWGERNDIYFLNKGEQRAFNYGKNFATGILQQALNTAQSQGRTKTVERIERDIRSIDLESRLIDARIDTAEELYKADRQGFYDAARTSFDNYAKIAESTRKGEVYKEDKYTRRLDSYFKNRVDNSVDSIRAMVQIAAIFPERSRVETLVDSIIKDKTGSFGAHVHYLSSYGVPLTKTDVTRLMVCSDNFNPNGNSKMSSYFLSKMDETFLANSLLQSYGLFGAKQFVQFIKDDKSTGIVNFNQIESILAQNDGMPLLTINGIQLHGAAHVLDFAARSLCANDSTRDFYEIKADISKNLVNIMNHFGTLDHNNPKCVNALREFIINPDRTQFEEKAEKFSEVGYVLAPHIAQDIAEKIAENRAAGLDVSERPVDRTITTSYETAMDGAVATVLKPGQTEIVGPVEVELPKELLESIERLTEALQAVTNALGSLNIKEIIGRMGFNTENENQDQNPEHEEHVDEEHVDEDLSQEMIGFENEANLNLYEDEYYSQLAHKAAEENVLQPEESLENSAGVGMGGADVGGMDMGGMEMS